MSQHFLRYVRQEGWFSFLKYSGCHTDQRDLRTDLNRRCIRFSIEVKKMQSVSTAQHIDVDTMKATTAGQHIAKAMQDSLYRGLLDHRARDIEQGSIPAIGRRQSLISFRHGHQTSIVRTDLPHRGALNWSGVQKCLGESVIPCAVASQLPKLPGTNARARADLLLAAECFELVPLLKP